LEAWPPSLYVVKLFLTRIQIITMFSKNKDSDQAKIRLPRRSLPPGVDYLPHILSQAEMHRGREIEVMWSEMTGARTFSLICKYDRQHAHPIWTLWEDDGRETKLAWQYESGDINLINDMLCMRDSSQAVFAHNQGVNPTTRSSEFDVDAVRRQAGLHNKSLKASLSNMKAAQQPNQSSQNFPAAGSSGLAAGFHSSARNPQLGGQVPDNSLIKARKPSVEFDASRFAESVLNRPLAEPEPDVIPVYEAPIAPANLEAADESWSIMPGIAGPPEATTPPAADFGAEPERQRIPDNAYDGSPAAAAQTAVIRAYRALTGGALNGTKVVSPSAFEGDLTHTQVSTLLQSVSMSQLTGKLEVIGEESVGRVYFEKGLPVHAATGGNTGDSAISELVAWLKGQFRFIVEDTTLMRSVNNRLDATIMEGIALLDQRKHLEKEGLTHESFLVKRHKKLSEGELKVFLTKGQQVDFKIQSEVYKKIGNRCTLADLLRDKPMEPSLWTPILFNFLTCGLIEIKPPEALAKDALDFLGDAKSAVLQIEGTFIRPETGIYTYAALLYFLQYEFHRFEAYGWPVTLVVFDMNRRSGSSHGGSDLISTEETMVASKRIELIKRPLDMFAHFEALHYGLLLPNTSSSSGAYVANRVLQAMTATPLSPALDKKNFHVAFGVASLPHDGDDIESMILAAKAALTRAKEADFPIVVAHTTR
jgi:GGDEF domain-containing protein